MATWFTCDLGGLDTLLIRIVLSCCDVCRDVVIPVVWYRYICVQGRKSKSTEALRARIAWGASSATLPTVVCSSSCVSNLPRLPFRSSILARSFLNRPRFLAASSCFKSTLTLPYTCAHLLQTPATSRSALMAHCIDRKMEVEPGRLHCQSWVTGSAHSLPTRHCHTYQGPAAKECRVTNWG